MRLLPRFTLAGAFALVVCVSIASAQDEPGFYGKIKQDVAYKEVSPSNKLDLYYPKETKASYPTHVFLHGGGWRGGSKNSIRGTIAAVFRQLADAGFLGISVDYRLTGKEDNQYLRTSVVDCMDALRYIAANAEELGVDKDNIFIWGDSAGGQLTLICATAPLSTFPGDNADPAGGVPIKGVVAWYPPTDMLEYEAIALEYNKKPRDLSQRMGRTVEDDPVAFIEVSPLHHLTRNDPPVLLIHGDRDITVHHEHSVRFANKAKEIGVPCELIMVENANHSFRKVGDKPIKPDIRTISKETARFFIDKAAEKKPAN